MAEKPPSASTTTPQEPPQASPQPAISKKEGEKLSPTRFGDWERNGRCIDF